MSLFSELRRRNIFRVALLYIVLAWLIIEVCGLLVLLFDLPVWIYRFTFAMLVIGFPLCLVFSWIYEITPDGLKREFEVERKRSITRETGRRLNRLTLACIALIILINLVSMLAH